MAVNDTFKQEYRGSPSGRLVRAPGGPGSFWAFVPNDLPPELPQSPELAILLSRANIAIGELSGVGRLLPNPALLIRSYAAREAVTSSPKYYLEIPGRTQGEHHDRLIEFTTSKEEESPSHGEEDGTPYKGSIGRWRRAGGIEEKLVYDERCYEEARREGEEFLRSHGIEVEWME